MDVSNAFLDTLRQTQTHFKDAVPTGIEKRGAWSVITVGGLGPEKDGVGAILETKNANIKSRPVMPDDGTSLLVTVGKVSVSLMTADTDTELTNKLSSTFGV